MTRRFVAIAIAVVLSFAAGTSWSQSTDSRTITKVGTTSAQFLKIGVGARAMALGGSFVANANDLSALYWNAAGLAHISGSAFQVAYTQYLADVDYSYAAFGTNLGGAGTVAVSVIFLDSGNMPVRTVTVPEGTGESFKVQDLAIQLSYGRFLTDRFTIGGAVKYIREAIWHSSATSFALDVGAQFVTPYERLKLAASISNFGSSMQMTGRDIMFGTDPDELNQGNVEVVNAAYETNQFSLPLLFRVGLAWDAVVLGSHTLVLSTDAAHPNDNSEYVNLGAEYDFRELLALRIGYKNLFETDGEQGLTAGAGLNIRLDRALAAKVDYAYADFGRLNATHWFTVGLEF
jgi:hypothetical protein